MQEFVRYCFHEFFPGNTKRMTFRQPETLDIINIKTNGPLRLVLPLTWSVLGRCLNATSNFSFKLITASLVPSFELANLEQLAANPCGSPDLSYSSVQIILLIQ